MITARFKTTSLKSTISWQEHGMMKNRISMLSIIRSTAELIAKRSTCSARAAVGAVLFDDKMRIVSTGYNGQPRGMPHCDDAGCDLDADGHCKNAVHAEINAIIQCAIAGRSTEGLRLFCTHMPCIRCANVIAQSGITEVFYSQTHGDSSATRNLFDKVDVKLHDAGKEIEL
jgi:dCMP deaminase